MTTATATATPIPTLLAAAGLGAVAGLRSMLPLALLSARLTRAPHPAAGPVALLGRPGVGRALILAAAAELVADKLPFVPARTTPLPLAGRLAAGAVVAAAASQIGHAAQANGIWRRGPARRWLLPALAGGAAALGGSLIGYRFRAAGARLQLPDLPLAFAEDAAALLIARAALARLERVLDDQA
jgi:uncharacterized membrane protein